MSSYHQTLTFLSSARIFLPKSLQPGRKLPVLLYIHGGAFCMESPFSTTFHNFVSTVVSAADVVAVSVDDGLFPDRPIPACYDDSWAASQWVSAHKDCNGPGPG
uniref:Alpha/beta hydrolase fold-3 domain-containing protein n=1 Tax=Cannabis sativa TaxID=3483 RepID=A0A803NKL2_CANSA